MVNDASKTAASPANDAFSHLKRGKVRSHLSNATRKLEVPENAIPGYRLYWFLGRNVPRAIQEGWYEFVDSREISLNNKGVANDSSLSGNADLGSRVSVLAGTGPDGQPEHLYLMKLKEEWWQESQKELEEKNQRTLENIFKRKGLGTERDEDARDTDNRYIDHSRSSMKKTGFKKPF